MRPPPDTDTFTYKFVKEANDPFLLKLFFIVSTSFKNEKLVGLHSGAFQLYVLYCFLRKISSLKSVYFHLYAGHFSLL